MSVTEETEIHGICATGYEPVRDAFAENFAERGEIGAAVAVVAHGEPVVDLWAGWADPACTRPWEPSTLTNVWSTTKPMTALCMHILMDRAGIDPDMTVASIWPEFAQGGKADIPLRWVLSHRSGLSGISAPLTAKDLEDWEKITTLLAAQEPLWEPGTESGYHAVTFGFLVGEIVRRITGQSLGAFFAGEVAGPMGADFHIGIAQHDLERCSDVQPPQLSDEDRAAMAEAFSAAHPAAWATWGNPTLAGGEANAPGWRMAEIPAANGHGTALALATIFGSLVDGSQRLITPATLQKVCTSQGKSTDLVLGVPMEFGLGFVLSGDAGHYGPNPAAFGHDGFGGSGVWADPEAGVAGAYVMNRMVMNLLDDGRRVAIVDGISKSLGQPG
jgi:CubicO group peptidase (beta-lactamase class C family)